MKTLPSPIVWDRTRKNVPDRQLCVNFENRQKVLNHSTLLTAPKYSLAIIFFPRKNSNTCFYTALQKNIYQAPNTPSTELFNTFLRVKSFYLLPFRYATGQPKKIVHSIQS